MFCKKCGAALPAGTQFCSKCGANLSGGNVQQPKKKVNLNIKELFTGTKKKYAIAASAAIGVLVVAVSLLAILFLPNTAVNGFKSQIRNREYHDAYLTYEGFDSEDRTKANKWMREYIGTVTEDYYADKLDYSTTTEILEELMQFDAAYSEAAEAGEEVYLDNRSTIAFDKAKAYAAEEKWQEAYKELEHVHIKYRLYDEVSALRSECATNVRTDALEQLKTFAASGEIDKLIAARDLALTVLPDDKEIIQAAQAHLDAFVTKTLADAKTLADSEDYAGAIELLQYAAGMCEHEEFWSAIENYTYDSAEAHCEALVAQNDLLGAVKYAKELTDTNSMYGDLLKKYAEPLVQNTLDTAKGYADNRQFEKAIQTIAEAQIVYDCDSFEEAIEEYTSYLPQKLSKIQTIENDNDYWIELGTVTDVFNVERERVCSGGSYGGTVIFYLSGRFINLSGQLVATKYRGGHAGNYISIRIYADDVLIYESGDIDYTKENFNINLDITGTRQLKLVLHAGTIFDATVS